MSQKGVHRISAAYGVTLFAVKAANFLLLPVFTHVIPTSEYGVYSLVMAAYALLTALLTGGIQSAFTKFYIPEDEANRKRVFGFFLSSAIVFALISAAAVWIFSSPLSYLLGGNENYRSLVRVISLILVFESISTFFLLLFKARELVRYVVWYSFFISAVTVSLTVYLVLYARMGITGIALGQLAGVLAGCFVMAPAARGYLSAFKPKQFFRPVMLFAMPLVLSGVLSTIADFGDRFILDRFLSKSDVGIYSFVYRIGIVVNVYILSFRSAWIPRALSTIQAGEYRTEFGKVFTKLLGICFGMALLVLALYPYFFSVRFGDYTVCNPAYMADRTVLFFIMLGYVFSGLMAFFSFAPFATGKSGGFVVSDGIAAAANMLFNFLLIPLAGITGAAGATAAGFVLGAFYLYRLAGRTHPVQYEKAKLLFLLAVFSAAAGAMLLMDSRAADAVLLLCGIAVIVKVLDLRFRASGNTGN